MKRDLFVSETCPIRLHAVYLDSLWHTMISNEYSKDRIENMKLERRRRCAHIFGAGILPHFS